MSMFPLPRAARVLFATASLVLLAACATLPPRGEPPTSNAFTDTAQSRIGRAATRLAAPHAGLTGARALIDAREAFVARALLAQGAEHSIDVQTYIWHADTSGSLLAQALWEAAERGVRVRVLLDDANTTGMDETIAALDAHPSIEVRLFNPFANRTWRLADFATDFGRVNRRMHNKSFTVDNQATVVGGRNIGDEYLGAETSVAFTDLDVLAIGPVVQQVSSEFDRYWNSAPAWPAATLLAPPAASALEDTRRFWAAHHGSPKAMAYLEAVRRQPLLASMTAGTLEFDWVPARVISDAPEKVLLPVHRRDVHLAPRLHEAFGQAERELVLVSPYFVPGEEATASLVAMAARGVRVTVLTNSLAATDVTAVYAGYQRYRRELLRGGVHLYELKPAAIPPRSREDDDERRGGMGGSQGGSSSASLHAKTFAVDRARIFIGSFNLDPRSVALNTEMGVVLESAAFARQLSDVARDVFPRDAYELRLEGENVVWIEHTPAGEVRHATTPGVGLLRNLWVGFLSLLPIESLL